MVAGIAFWISTRDISALPQPSRFETWTATTIRGWYIHRAAAHSSLTMPANDASEVSAGQGLFGMACASCHGTDGRSSTNIGKSMYPRAPDLGSPEVQKLSNPELFWVIRNGIRLSGMPGFGNVLSNDEIWQATYYVRSLRESPNEK
ncbi:MAG TPA: cytochrome c [Acidimicrobiales bacterium]|nr:cytochrome c [Acidimicrobiales bacterium]